MSRALIIRLVSDFEAKQIEPKKKKSPADFQFLEERLPIKSFVLVLNLATNLATNVARREWFDERTL